jgi:hypothetical protein
MTFTSNYFFRTFLLLITVTSFSQEVTKDSIPVKNERYGIRAGIDLYKVTLGFFDEGYRGIELVGDMRLTRKIYAAVELGNEDKTVDDDKINFTTKGSYIRIGADYNMYENWLDMENLIYVGMRYGFSTFSHRLNTYQVYTPFPYFGESPIIDSGENFDGLSAHWLEVVLGLKAEVIKNVYAGFSVRFNYLLVNNPPDGFDNLYIPGFNRTYEGNFGFGFNYTLSYFIPVYKKKVKPAAEK